MFPRLGENLDGHIVRNEIILDQTAEKFVLRLGSCRKPDLNFLKADFDQKLVKIDFLFQIHRDDERLVPVAKVHTAPLRRFVNMVFFCPVKALFRRKIILSDIAFIVFHNFLLCLLKMHICTFLQSAVLMKKALRPLHPARDGEPEFQSIRFFAVPLFFTA